MNPIDYALYSAMNTVELSLTINRERNCRHDSELSKRIMSKMRHLKKRGRINKRVFKYFVDSIQPGSTGFSQRWVNRYARYMEINAMESRLSGNSDFERLEALFGAFADKGLIVRTAISDEEEFSDKEADAVAEKGFVGIAKSQLDAFDSNGELKDLAQLSCRLPDRETIVWVMKTTQTYGFSLYEPETYLQPRKVGFLGLIK